MKKILINNEKTFEGYINDFKNLTFIPLVKATDDKIVDYTNIDYSSIKFSVLTEELEFYKGKKSAIHNSNIFISELYSEEFNVRLFNSNFSKIYAIEAKSTDGDDIIVIATPSTNLVKYLHAIEFLNYKGQLYYKPFEHLIKLMEICLYNLDELPESDMQLLREKYHNDIKIKKIAYTEESLKKDIVNDSTTIFSQNDENLNKLEFLGFEYNKIIKLIISNYSEKLFINTSNSKTDLITRFGYTNHNITSKIYSLDEFKKLHYGQGTLSELSFYYIKPIDNEHYWTNIINDIPVNRVKSLALSNLATVKFYDWADSQYLYTLGSNNLGNIYETSKSQNKYAITDLLNVIKF